MSRALLILLLACSYVGCAGRARPGPADLGALRILEHDTVATSIRHSLRGSPPFARGWILPKQPRRLAATSGCARLRIAPGRFADGDAVTAETLIEAWTRELRVPGSPVAWLLGPLDESGLRAEGEDLVACFDRSLPDWEDRLSHPGLWPVRPDGSGAGPYVPGPTAGGWTRNPALTGPPESFDEIRFVDAGKLAADTLIALAEVDLAIVYGREIARLRVADLEGFDLEPLAGWDRTYALWLDPQARWINDPPFRKWLAAQLDRVGLARLLFGEEAIASAGLLSGGPSKPEVPVASRPFDSRSIPRLALGFDPEDPYAARIAARLKARLREIGIELTLPQDSPGRSSRAGLVLFAHHPPVGDPVLGLQHTLRSVTEVDGNAEDAWRFLRLGAEQSNVTDRLALARQAEQKLLADGRLIPLVRLPAWVVRNANGRAVSFGPYGVLRFGDPSRFR